jgi:hypothetical protein
MDLKSHASVAEYFYEVVTDAIRNQGVDTSETAEYYLVNLLAAYTKTSQVRDDEPLALKAMASVFASPDERVRHLKDVGDTSLYISGFFADSLQRRLVDVDYYIQIGGRAYGDLARHFQVTRGAEAGRVYVELHDKFPRFVEVLAEISERSSMTTPQGVVQLYERWLRTGSERVAQRLRAQGVLPKKSEIQ